jgi:hypothetical protein
VICDGWLQMLFPTAEAAEVLLLKTAQLRDKWEQLITLKLQGKNIENYYNYLSQILCILYCLFYLIFYVYLCRYTA